MRHSQRHGRGQLLDRGAVHSKYAESLLRILQLFDCVRSINIIDRRGFAAPLDWLDGGLSAVESIHMSGEPEPRKTHGYGAAEVADRLTFTRRVASTNLLAMAAGAAVIGASILALDSQASRWVNFFTVPIVFLALWITMAYRTASKGLEKRRVGYYPIAAIAVVMLFFGALPLGSSIGYLTLMGIGFFIIGFRERCSPVWLSAGPAMVLGLLATGETSRSILGIENTDNSQKVAGLAILIFAVIVSTIGIWFRSVESKALVSE